MQSFNSPFVLLAFLHYFLHSDSSILIEVLRLIYWTEFSSYISLRIPRTCSLKSPLASWSDPYPNSATCYYKIFSMLHVVTVLIFLFPLC